MEERVIVKLFILDDIATLILENDVSKISKARAKNTFHELYSLYNLYRELYPDSELIELIWERMLPYLHKFDTQCNR